MAGLDFDDVLVVPQVSDVYSRDLVDISVNLPKGQHLSFPLFASPMVGVTDGQFVKRLSALGGLGIIHRFYSSREEQIADIKNNLTMGDKFGIAIKIGETNIEELIDLNPAILLVDTANGYTSKLYNYCEHIANYILSHNHYCNLMAGNVATEDGYVRLANAGCNIIRVGIGGGSVCSTRNVTGVGIPNITAILLCAEAKASRGESAPKIAIDGGIRSSGDFVKAVVAGADYGIAGKLFSQCYEAPNKGTLWGMAAVQNMKNLNIKIKSVEGFDIPIEKEYSLENFVSEFGYGIKSAGTYIGAKNLKEFSEKGMFIEVGDSSIKKNIYH
jgi:IMP dehydrogenase/GMP reductase